MYKDIKSKIVPNEGKTNFFSCIIGVRQGENFPPFLSNIFLNDLEHFLAQKHVNGFACDVNTTEISMYLKLLILLYADDTVSFSDNKDDLQLTFNVFSECCLQLRSTVNISKTKIVVFSEGRTKHYINFTFQTKNMEIVDTYKYLRIFLGKSGSYVQAKKHIAEQDNKALFGLL